MQRPRTVCRNRVIATDREATRVNSPVGSWLSQLDARFLDSIGESTHQFIPSQIQRLIDGWQDWKAPDRLRSTKVSMIASATSRWRSGGRLEHCTGVTTVAMGVYASSCPTRGLGEARRGAYDPNRAPKLSLDRAEVDHVASRDRDGEDDGSREERSEARREARRKDGRKARCKAGNEEEVTRTAHRHSKGRRFIRRPFSLRRFPDPFPAPGPGRRFSRVGQPRSARAAVVTESAGSSVGRVSARDVEDAAR